MTIIERKWSTLSSDNCVAKDRNVGLYTISWSSVCRDGLFNFVAPLTLGRGSDGLMS